MIIQFEETSNRLIILTLLCFSVSVLMLYFIPYFPEPEKFYIARVFMAGIPIGIGVLMLITLLMAHFKLFGTQQDTDDVEEMEEA